MSEYKLEVTSKQVIDFIGEDFCKFHGTFETYKCENSKVVNGGTGFLEGYFLIAKHKSKDCLYLKTWDKESDIPHSKALFDHSGKVKDIIFLNNDCKFYLSYLSRQGIVELTIDKNNKDDLNYPKIIYYFKLIEANDV